MKNVEGSTFETIHMDFSKAMDEVPLTENKSLKDVEGIVNCRGNPLHGRKQREGLLEDFNDRDSCIVCVHFNAMSLFFPGMYLFFMIWG